jgi:hypothetical protein
MLVCTVCKSKDIRYQGTEASPGAANNLSTSQGLDRPGCDAVDLDPEMSW